MRINQATHFLKALPKRAFLHYKTIQKESYRIRTRVVNLIEIQIIKTPKNEEIMKKYEEPKVKLHELKVKTSMLAGSGPIENQARTFSSETTQDANNNDEPATQGFTSRNAW